MSQVPWPTLWGRDPSLSRASKASCYELGGQERGQEGYPDPIIEGAPRCDHRSEDWLPTEHHGRAPELLHHPAVVETDGMEQKKRSVGTAQRDEWLRAAWKVTLAQHIDSQRLVFVDLLGEPTLRLLRSMPIHRGDRLSQNLVPVSRCSPSCPEAWNSRKFASFIAPPG